MEWCVLWYGKQEWLLTSGLYVNTWDFCIENRWWVHNLRQMGGWGLLWQAVDKSMYHERDVCPLLVIPVAHSDHVWERGWGETITDIPSPHPCMHGNKGLAFPIFSKLWFRGISSRWEKVCWCCSGKDHSHCSARGSLIISWAGCSFFLVVLITNLQKIEESSHFLLLCWAVSLVLQTTAASWPWNKVTPVALFEEHRAATS